MTALTLMGEMGIAALTCALSVATAANAGAGPQSSPAVQTGAIVDPGERVASTPDQDPPPVRLPADLPSVAVSPPVGRVTVSRASDMIGRPVFAARQSFSGSDRLVGFSTRRPVIALTSSFAAMSRISLPGQLPLNATAMTSRFGYRKHPFLGGYRIHSGIDLAAPTGTPVFATSDGTVSAAGWRGGYGLLVALDHPGAVQTRYGHLSQLNVAQGQQVRRGDIVGFVGSTGMSTGPHLHYEIRTNGRAVNPLGGNR